MFCANCGKEIPDTSKFCPYCGVEKRSSPLLSDAGESSEVPPQQPSDSQQPSTEQQTSTWQQPEPGQPGPGQQQPAWQQPSDSQQSAWQPQNQQPQSQQQPAWQQPGQQPEQPPVGQAPAMTMAPPPSSTKKSHKTPIIVAVAVVILVAICGVTLMATGVLSNLFDQKSALSAFYEGSENLFYETSSATLEVRAGINMTLKWDLGDDLAHSTIWGYTGGAGFVYRDDTIYVYTGDNPSSSRGSGSGTTLSVKESDIIGQMNRELRDTYHIDVDLNKLVRNGKFDKDYLEELNRTIDDASIDADNFYESLPDDLDSVKVTEIIDDFMSKEVNKKRVYEKFMSETEKESSAGTTTYQATIDPVAFFAALGDYAAERGRNADYANAADEIATLCDETEEIESYIKDFTIEISLEKDVLVGLVVDLNMSSGAVSATMETTNINITDLDNDAELQSILNAPLDSGGYGDFGDFL